MSGEGMQCKGYWGLIALLIALLYTHSIQTNAQSEPNGVCHGRFLNPASDVCWQCIFPISIGSTEIAAFGMEDNPADNAGSPVCTCPIPAPPYERIGISVGFWEPLALIDVTKDPLCMTNLGTDFGADGQYIPAGFNDSNTATNETASFYQVHYYHYPLFDMLRLVADDLCLESSSSFDLAYITEYDVLWDSDELSFILNPDAALFANNIAQFACAADCIAATIGFPLDPLFWCAGCQGSVYPLNGHVDAHTGGVQGGLLLAERMLAKLHRQGQLPITSGQSALCHPYSSGIIKKSQYKWQITYPIPRTTAPFCCNPYGRTEMISDPGQEYPVAGEDFGFLIWRKRNCCMI
jgi:conjugal transfer pilus assembly protein TraU